MHTYEGGFEDADGTCHKSPAVTAVLRARRWSRITRSMLFCRAAAVVLRGEVSAILFSVLDWRDSVLHAQRHEDGQGYVAQLRSAP